MNHIKFSKTRINARTGLINIAILNEKDQEEEDEELKELDEAAEAAEALDE